MSVLGSFAAPPVYDRTHQAQLIMALQRELDKTYRKDASLIVPFDKELGFTSPFGVAYTFSVDENGNFVFGAQNETPTSLASINYVTSVLADADGATASQLEELRVEFQAADASLSASVTNETTARVSADGALASQIASVEAGYQSADAVISASVTTETSARISADGVLASQITALDVAYQAADAVISASVTAETSARISADGALASDITALDAAYQAADAVISASVTTEATARASADSALASDITALDAAYQAADTVLQANITSEASARASADSAIASSVTTLTSTVNAKNQTFIQTSAPTAIAAGDLWIDSDDNNKLYRATAPGSGSWVAIPYSDTGKVTTFAQTTAPTATAVGDLWIDTDDDNKVYRATATGSGSWVAVDDARIAITATTLATVQGYLSASYTIELDVNGRATVFRLQDDGTTSDIIFKADTFKFFDGVNDAALFSASGGIVTINGDLAVSGSLRVGGAVRWPVSAQSIALYAADGEAVEWASGGALNQIPNYTILEPKSVALASGEAWEAPTLQSVTTTGGTLRLKIITPGATSSVTDTTDSAGGGGDPDRVMTKADSADAYNGIYNFTFDGEINIVSESIGGGDYFHNGQVIYSPWFDDGGGWDEGPAIVLNVVDILGYDISAVDLTGAESFTITVAVSWANAIGQHGGEEWGLSHESGGALIDFTSVQYIKQATSGTRTGSPNGEVATIIVTPKNAA